MISVFGQKCLFQHGVRYHKMKEDTLDHLDIVSFMIIRPTKSVPQWLFIRRKFIITIWIAKYHFDMVTKHVFLESNIRDQICICIIQIAFCMFAIISSQVWETCAGVCK